MQYICRPCAAHILCLQAMCSICIGICGLCTQHIFKHGAKHICRPALNRYATSAHHIPGLFGFAQNIFASFVQSIFAGPGRHIGILAGLCSTPCPAEIGVAYRWAVLFWPLVLCPAQLVLAGFVVSYLQDLGGRLTDTGGLHGYLTSLGGVHHICIWETRRQEGCGSIG